jgi:hypothetical protein
MRRGIEVVITGLTRNQHGNPSAPKAEMPLYQGFSALYAGTKEPKRSHFAHSFPKHILRHI